MSEIPSGWFDDPEDPTQLRYWDGNQWTEHRTPKMASAPSESGDGIGSLIVDAYRLVLKNWSQLLGIWALSLVGFLAGFIVFAAGAIGALSPRATTILSRVTSDGFDPNDVDDKAFLESITLDPNAGFWVMTIAAILLLIASSIIHYGATTSRLASSLVGEPLSVADCLRRSLRKAPRWIGIHLLWMMGLAVYAVVVSVILAVAVQVPFTLALAIPLVLASITIAYPILWLAPTVLLAGPDGQPPLRTAIRLFRSGWGSLALRVLCIHIVIILILLASGIIGVIPVIGQLAGLAVSWAVASFGLASALVIYHQAGGRLAPEFGDES